MSVCVYACVCVCGEYVQERRKKARDEGCIYTSFHELLLWVCVSVYTCLCVYAICDTYKQGIKTEQNLDTIAKIFF